MHLKGANDMADTAALCIRDLPEQLTKKVNNHIRLFAVTMLITDNEDSAVIPCAGTLASIKGHKGIITARHVWKEMTKHKCLLIMLGQVPHIIDINLLNAVLPPIQSRHEKILSNIPDLAFIMLPEHSINHIESISKAFFSIDKRRDKESMEFFRSTVGYFALFGAPEQWIDYQKKAVPSFVYSTYMSEYFEYEGWDYQIMDINLDANPEIPKSFGGVERRGDMENKILCQ